MPTFKYDGKEIPFQPGETIIRAAEKQGVEIPHYCYHPGLSAPANCRMCLVEIMPAANQRPVMLDILEWDAAKGEYVSQRKPKLLPACQMQATEGLEVKGDSSDHVIQARKSVQEFLLLNHPVDCPICDQAGECKLQDYWLEHGQFEKRMRDEPVHKPKAVSFGPTIVYDAERCVMCTRCVRFMAEVAKDPVLTMRERGNLNEITVAPGRELDGKYTFMTEHVCPVGALTTKDFRFKARVWFLKSANSVCQGCATGCNAHLDFDPRTDKVYRYRPRTNEAVNQYWMCDDGMLSYRAATEGRITEARLGSEKSTVQNAFERIEQRFKGYAKESVAILLSAQHSLEDNFALVELAKAMGTSAFYLAKAPDGYADTILIHADKNPNSAGVRRLVPSVKPFASLATEVKAGRVTHVIGLGHQTDSDESALANLAAFVVLASHHGPLTKLAHITLPACSWADAAGTYVNAKGFSQVSDKAIQPLGDSRPAWDYLREVARLFGVELPFTKLRDLRGRMTPPTTSATTTASAVQGGT